MTTVAEKTGRWCTKTILNKEDIFKKQFNFIAKAGPTHLRFDFWLFIDAAVSYANPCKGRTTNVRLNDERMLQTVANATTTAVK